MGKWNVSERVGRVGVRWIVGEVSKLQQLVDTALYLGPIMGHQVRSCAPTPV
jgi:hypothetical protein